MITHFMGKNSILPPYMAYPRFLLNEKKLSETAKILYVLLLDRTRLSIKNEGWVDEQGKVYVLFPIKSLADTLGRSEMAVKNALTLLENEELIFRKRQGVGLPNRIYVKLPETQTERNLSVCKKEDNLSKRKSAVYQKERIVSGKNIDKNNKSLKENSRPNCYGKFNNVFLSDAEIDNLSVEIPEYKVYIEKLSSYMASTGKHYTNHAATIYSWALKERPTDKARIYECEEGESL